jgi:membrane-associated phospholipid phosphatase
MDVAKLDPTAKTSVFDYIGFYAPNALSLLVAVLLLNQLKYLAVFVIFFFVNHYVNHSLKEYIRQPRPTGSRPLVDESYDRTNYGMPSYHSQMIWFVTVFLYLVKRNVRWLIAFVAIAFLTMYQRWKYKAHSITQLAAGGALGTGIAFLAYSLTNAYLRRTREPGFGGKYSL